MNIQEPLDEVIPYATSTPPACRAEQDSGRRWQWQCPSLLVSHDDCPNGYALASECNAAMLPNSCRLDVCQRQENSTCSVGGSSSLSTCLAPSTSSTLYPRTRCSKKQLRSGALFGPVSTISRLYLLSSTRS